MNWLLKFDAMRLLQAQIPVYRRFYLPLSLVFVVCLAGGTQMWLGAPLRQVPQLYIVYPLTYLLPTSYTGIIMVLLVYMLFVLCAGHLSLEVGGAQTCKQKAALHPRSPAKHYWIQGFGWFVHTALLCQLALVPLLSSHSMLWILGLAVLAEMFVLFAVPAALAIQGGELMDAVACVHRQNVLYQVKIQTQLWAISVAVAALWLSFVCLMSWVCLPAEAYNHYHARTLAIAAQMAWSVLLPLHALASVHSVQKRLRLPDAAQSSSAVTDLSLG
jgi:hypothetical protein